jgi:hypothetical protein
MQDWYPGYSERRYVDGLAATCSHHDTCDLGSPFSWALHGAELPHGPLMGLCPAEADAQEACDAAAVAWVLVALAKRAAAWAEGIDARLARDLRAAVECLHGVVHDPDSTGAEYQQAADAATKAEHALLRGWP